MNNNDLLSKVKRIHFIGIGGSGMCPLAEILHHNGYQLTGSDRDESDTLERIRSYGIPVFMGQSEDHIGNAELVVYSAAIEENNPERLAASKRNIPCIERSVLLGMLSDRYRHSIAVSGTHGKTTTTAMITQLLLEGGKDPSAVIGGKLPLIHGNGRTGHSDMIVCEACEYVDTFLHLHPYLSVILNIEADHLDYFGTLDRIIQSFHQFALQTSGILLVNGDDANIKQAMEGIPREKIITFGYSPENDYYPIGISDSPKACENFSICYHGDKICEVSLNVPGRHNILNALAAFATAHIMGVSTENAVQSLQDFKGVHRRFEILGHFNGITVADDFAHHPTELTATLTAAMHMGFNEVWALFQPHTFSRTAMFLDDFAKALSIPDHTIVSEILPVRETNTYHIYATDLVEKIPNAVYLKTFAEMAEYVTAKAKPGDLIITLGGGDIYKCAHLIMESYQNK